MEITPFLAMEVMEKAQELEAEGKDIVHLEIGEPDFATPEPVRQAAARAIASGDTHYTHSMGKIQLRRAICDYYARIYNVTVDPRQVMVSAGTSPAMLIIFSALLQGEGEVILSDPYYACYPNYVQLAGGRPVLVPVEEEDGFKYRPESIKKKYSPRTKAIMFNSPANPTGTVFSARELEELASFDVPLVADEIYHGLNYGGKDHTILEFTDNAFVINGFSKKYAMTGWRLGYVIAPKRYVRAMQKLQQNLIICAGSFVQTAAMTALSPETDPYVDEMVKTYDRRRRYVWGRVREMGIATAVEPTGAFYVLANVKKYTGDSLAFAFQVLEEAGVAVTPGIDFGPHCEGYIRISYATSIENLEKGLDRLAQFLQRLPHKRNR